MKSEERPCVQIEFETEGKKHVFGFLFYTCVFQPLSRFTALFDLKSCFFFSWNVHWANCMAFTVVGIYFPISPTEPARLFAWKPSLPEKTPTTQHKTMRITIWPFAISTRLSGFHFPAYVL